MRRISVRNDDRYAEFKRYLNAYRYTLRDVSAKAGIPYDKLCHALREDTLTCADAERLMDAVGLPLSAIGKYMFGALD